MNPTDKARAQETGTKPSDTKSSDTKSANSQPDQSQEITRDDLAAKLTELRDSMPYLGQEDSSMSEGTVKMLAAGLGLAAAYFYGWRRGRRNTAVIQVRRTNLVK